MTWGILEPGGGELVSTKFSEAPGSCSMWAVTGGCPVSLGGGREVVGVRRRVGVVKVKSVNFTEAQVRSRLLSAFSFVVLPTDRGC